MTLPKITIITPVFNNAKDIRRLTTSIRTQDYPDIEWLVVDGGSTDGTVDILTNESIKNLTLISEPDKGIFDAMNKGVVRSTGEWLYFIGSDDYLFSNDALSRVFKTSDTDHAEIIYCDVFSEKLKRNYDGPTTLQKLLFINLCHQGIFYKRTVFDKVGLYSLKYKTYGDWEFNLRCFFDDDINIVYKKIVVAFYSDHGISETEGDIGFLREYLFPVNLKYLLENGKRQLNNIIFYDRWWRLIRKLHFRDGIRDAESWSQGAEIIQPVRWMISFQKRIPRSLLFTGISSKMLMTVSYLFSRLFSSFYR